MAFDSIILGIFLLANFVLVSSDVSPGYCTTLNSEAATTKRSFDLVQTNPTCIPSNGLCYHYSRHIENGSRTVEHFGCDDELEASRFADLKYLIAAIPTAEPELCSTRQSDTICVCRAKTGLAKSDSKVAACNFKWITQWRYRSLVPSDWPWILGTVALWTAGLLGWIGWSALRRGPVTEIKSETHVFTAKPISQGWNCFHVSMVFVQVVQAITCFIQLFLLWNPIFADCPLTSPPERYVPEYVATFQLINSTISFREISLTKWPQPLSVRLMALKIGCFATIVFTVYLLWQLVYFKTILSHRYAESGLILVTTHCIFGLTLSIIMDTGAIHAFQTVIKQACADKIELLRLNVFRINYYTFVSFVCVELIQLIIFNLKFWNVFFDITKVDDSAVKSEAESTAISANTAISYHTEVVDDLLISPTPFIISNAPDADDKLFLYNGYSDQWLTVRLLTKTPGIYTINPDKINVPPRRHVTVTVHRGSVDPKQQIECAILAEFFPLDDEHMFTPARNVWTRPYIVPRQQWKHKLIVVLYQLESKQ